MATATIPYSFTFRCLQQSQVTWTLTTTAGAPVTGLSVTATLYANTNIPQPGNIPGTIADTNFSNLVLTETPGGSGIYIGVVPEAFNPAQSIAGFVVVITASSGSTVYNTWTIPAIVVPPQNVNDLVELDDVKAWLSIPLANTDDDRVLQFLISGFSQYVLHRTGRASFTTISTYTEVYDGNGATRMFLRNYPILTLTSVLVGAYQIPQSTGLTYPGVYIEQSQKSIALRWSSFMNPPTNTLGAYTVYPTRFFAGQGNIQVIYSAGYQYVPYDLGEACMETIGVMYTRKDTRDLASKTLSATGGSGQSRYRDWFLTPGVNETIEYYTRRSILV